MSIRLRLLITVLVPVLAIALLATQIVRYQHDEVEVARRMQGGLTLIDALSQCIDAIQRERGLSSVRAAGGNVAQDLTTARAATDAALPLVTAALPGAVLPADGAREVAGLPQAITSLRQQIEGSRDSAEVRKRYTAVIASALKNLRQLANAPSSKGLGKVFASLVISEYGKEHLGRLRAAMSSTLAADKAIGLEASDALQDHLTQATAGLASPGLTYLGDTNERLAAVLGGEAWLRLKEDLRSVLTRAATGGFGRDSARCFADASAVMKEMATLMAAQRKLAAERLGVIADEAAARMWWSVGIGAGISLASLILAFLIARGVVRRIGQIAGALDGVAHGNLAPPAGGGSDEIGAITRNLATVLEGMRSALGASQVDWSEVARATAARRELEQRLSALVRQLEAISTSLAADMERTSAQAATISATATQVSGGIQAAAAGSEEMGASITEIARNSATGAQVNQEAVRLAEETGPVIDRLRTSSDQIGEILGLISAIAEQTNLLALNATIEAARAGDAGRGFAVVASEVKALANQTATATGDIRGRIEALRQDTANVHTAVERIRQITKQAEESGQTIAAAVEEQSATTREMGGNISESAQGVSGIAQGITAVATAIQEANRLAAEIQKAAAAMAAMAKGL